MWSSNSLFIHLSMGCTIELHPPGVFVTSKLHLSLVILMLASLWCGLQLSTVKILSTQHKPQDLSVPLAPVDTGMHLLGTIQSPLWRCFRGWAPSILMWRCFMCLWRRAFRFTTGWNLPFWEPQISDELALHQVYWRYCSLLYISSSIRIQQTVLPLVGLYQSSRFLSSHCFEQKLVTLAVCAWFNYMYVEL